MAPDMLAMTDAPDAADKDAVVAAVKDTLRRHGEVSPVWTVGDEWDETDANVWGLETRVGDVLIEVSHDGGDSLTLATHTLAADGSVETAGYMTWPVTVSDDWVRAFAERSPHHWL